MRAYVATLTPYKRKVIIAPSMEIAVFEAERLSREVANLELFDADCIISAADDDWLPPGGAAVAEEAEQETQGDPGDEQIAK